MHLWLGDSPDPTTLTYPRDLLSHSNGIGFLTNDRSTLNELPILPPLVNGAPKAIP